MLALRGEFIKENVTTDQPTLGDPEPRHQPRGLRHRRRQLLARRVGAHLDQLRPQQVERHVRDDQGPATPRAWFEHELLLRFAISL